LRQWLRFASSYSQETFARALYVSGRLITAFTLFCLAPACLPGSGGAAASKKGRLRLGQVVAVVLDEVDILLEDQ